MKMKAIFIILALIIVVTTITALAPRPTIKGTYYLYAYKKGDTYYDVEKMYDKYELKIYEHGIYELTTQAVLAFEDTFYIGTYEEVQKGEYIMKPLNKTLLKNGTGYLIIQSQIDTYYLKRSTIST